MSEEGTFQPNPSLNERWEQFKVKFERNYGSQAEEARRREIWENSVKIVDEQNEKYERGLSTWTAGENQFSDRTEDEKPCRTNCCVRPPSRPTAP